MSDTRPAWADRNEVTLQGRLGRDPESRSTAGGMVFVNFSVATGRKWKDKHSGEEKSVTHWHNIAVKFNEGAINTAFGLRKGQRVLVKGEITYRKWTDQSGTERHATEIEVSRFGSIEVVPDDWDGAPRQAAQPARQVSPRDLDDEIPF